MLSRVINMIGNRLPEFLSRQVARFPFSYRYGKTYTYFNQLAIEYDGWEDAKIESYSIENFNRIFQYAKKIDFYKEKYKKSGVFDLEIKTLADIKKIPMLTREEIRDNLNLFKGKYLEKTGGSSGNPLKVYLDTEIWSREWAHYHHIWSKIDYNYTDVKCVFKRENARDSFIRYSFDHNEYIVNTYNIKQENIEDFCDLIEKRKIQYFHGYPSSIYDFLRKIDAMLSEKQRQIIKNSIKCCFFSSEMLLPSAIKYVKDYWGFSFIVCYGHTEACVLASSDVNTLTYTPKHTYGYVEEENSMLLGTSFHNYDMPLIRYRTDDLIESYKNKNGLLKSFKIKKGRKLDFFYDRKGLKVYYLDLFYETEGEIFKYIHYLQFFQQKEGETTLFLTKKDTEDINVSLLLDLEKYDVEFKVRFIDEPMRTSIGKVPFKLTKDLIIKNGYE